MAKLSMHKNKVEEVLARTPSSILDFPEERLADLDALLFEGKGVHAIATIIQKEWGFYRGKAAKTVSRHIQQYQESDLGKSRMAELEAQEEKVLEQRFDRRVDVMRELEDLMLMQKDRLSKLYEKEKVMPSGLNLKQIDTMIRDLANTGTQLAKLQMATGVIAKAPTKVTGVVTDPEGTRHPFSWTTATESLFQRINEIDGQAEE